jgi:hypothetical protein
VLWEAQGRDFKSGPQWTLSPGMKLDLFYNLKFTEVYINLEKDVIIWTSCQILNLFGLRGVGGSKLMKYLKGGASDESLGPSVLVLTIVMV